MHFSLEHPRYFANIENNVRPDPLEEGKNGEKSNKFIKTQKDIESQLNQKDSNETIGNAFGKMVDQTIDPLIANAKDDPEKRKKLEDKREQMKAEGQVALNDPSLNSSGKLETLQRILGTFRENREFFPQNSDQTQLAQNNENSKNDFFEKMKAALSVGKQAQQTQQARKMAATWPPEGQSAGNPEKTAEANDFLKRSGLA